MAQRGINKMIVCGYIGQDPKYRENEKGATFSLSLATSEMWQDKNTGEQRERTEWHNAIAYNNLAKAMNKFDFSKGDKLYIEGLVRTNKWKDEAGVERSSKEIVINEFEPMSTASEKNNSVKAPPTDTDIPF